MGGSTAGPEGHDLSAGMPLAAVSEGGMVRGHVGAEPVLLSSLGSQITAVGGACTHYGAPLADGIVVGETVRCPWHHACFSLRTGEALAAPAFAPLERWKVDVEGDTIFVREKLSAPAPTALHRQQGPNRIVIVGGGAAGFAAAEMLRRRGYDGQLTMLSSEDMLPCDRPNLSKDYLAGTAPESWLPLKDQDFYRSNSIDLRMGARVVEIDPVARTVATHSGENFAFDRLLLATGSEPVRLDGPGFDRPNVHTLRSLTDSRAIIADAAISGTAVVIGASFIGLEAAAALVARGLQVRVVAPDAVPMKRVLGRDLGQFIRSIHEEKGVIFHLGQTTKWFDGRRVKLSGDGEIPADLVVLGVGVRPRLELAQQAGIAVDGGVLVDPYLETNVPGVYAAGDIARYRDPRSLKLIRVEHWVAAQRQGQTAACNMLGDRQRFTAVPFFWSRHYELSIRYVGHAERYDRIKMSGSVDKGDATLRFMEGGRVMAAASIGRDRESLEIEAEFEAANAVDPCRLSA